MLPDLPATLPLWSSLSIPLQKLVQGWHKLTPHILLLPSYEAEYCFQALQMVSLAGAI